MAILVTVALKVDIRAPIIIKVWDDSHMSTETVEGVRTIKVYNNERHLTEYTFKEEDIAYIITEHCEETSLMLSNQS